MLSTGVATARHADALYEIKKTEPKVAVGGHRDGQPDHRAKAGWHVNAEAPITVALTAPAGVTVQKAKLTRADLAAEHAGGARFDIPVCARPRPARRPSTPRRRFVLCQEQACKPVKETLALAIEVTPAAARARAKNTKKPRRSSRGRRTRAVSELALARTSLHDLLDLARERAG